MFHRHSAAEETLDEAYPCSICIPAIALLAASHTRIRSPIATGVCVVAPTAATSGAGAVLVPQRCTALRLAAVA
jgi:hypothetical protein